MSNEFGVHSEVGKLRKVIVHRPDLSLKRLTPTNHDELLFDDVLWVERAQWEHDQFVKAMRDRGVEVYYHLDLLGEALAASEEARKNVIELVASEYTVGWSLVDEVREFLSKMKPDVLAKHLVGGLTVGEMEAGGFDLAKFKEISLGAAAVADEPGYFVIPPVPNSLFQRDPSCWIYNGVTVNPMFWPARRREALNMLTIYRYHPMFQEAKFNFWYPEQNDDGGFNIQDFGRASLEGGDVQPIGNGTVAIGMSERTQARMIEMVAKELFEKGGAERVIVAVMTKDRAHMHLDTVFTLLDRDIATAFPKVVNNIRAISLRPGKKAGRLPCDRGERASSMPSPMRSRSRSSTSSRPAAMNTRRSASSGTTPTTPWRWSRVWSSPTSAIPSPSPRCARRASKWSPLPGSSWARDAAAVTA